MNETRTSNLGTFGIAVAPEQKKYWIEIQLIDEQKKPVANMPYMADNHPSLGDEKPASFTGVSDSNGIIRIEDLTLRTLFLKIEAQPLADEMEKRPLGPGPRRSAYERKMSPIGVDEETGCIVYYTVIGDLCNRAPKMECWDEQYKKFNKTEWVKYKNKKIGDDKSKIIPQYPEFHFPDPLFPGLGIDIIHFNQKIFIEICPFRSWKLLLHNTKDYSIVNAYNQGLMANLTYEDSNYFFKFFDSFRDLTSVPSWVNGYQTYHALVIDVPFREGYKGAVFLDTAEFLKDQPELDSKVIIKEEVEGKLQIRLLDSADTQLFYFYSDEQVVVAWRGSQELDDWLSDFTFRPILTSSLIENSKIPQQMVPEGFVHKGFWDAFRLAKDVFDTEFELLFSTINKLPSVKKSLYICGHSLGGALSLIHATDLKKSNPVLYTYGMPRVFTLSAIKYLEGITHYRHVNDADLVTFVPPEAQMDNNLYDLFGTFVGFLTSVTQLINSKVNRGEKDECYLHHGDIVIFFKAEQHYTRLEPTLDIDGGVHRKALVMNAIFSMAKFYLVPALNSEAYSQAEELQKKNTALFPPNANPQQDSMINPMHHLMGDRYLPFLSNQLIELIDPAKPMERKRYRQKFINKINPYSGPGKACEDERQRNLLFNAMQEKLSVTLEISKKAEGGSDALERFRSLQTDESDEL